VKNLAEFQILGIIERVKTAGKYLTISVCAKYPEKIGEVWKVQEYWNTISVVDERLKHRARAYCRGDLVFIRGRIRHVAPRCGSCTSRTVELVAEELSSLASRDRSEN
jgi:hypothetical protein